MNLHLTFKNIDYKSLISFVNENAGHLFGFLGLSNLNGLAVRAINSGETFLIQKLHTMCHEQGVDIRLNGIHADLMDADTIKLTADVEEIDVASVAGLLLPALQKQLEADSQLSFLVDTMQAHPEAFTSCISSFMKHLNKDEKDKLMISTINAFDDKIMDAVEEFAKDKKLEFTVVSLLAE